MESGQYGVSFSTHTIVFSGQTTASTTAEADSQRTVFQLTGNYNTGPFTLYSGGGLVELTGGGTMSAQSVSGLDLLISSGSLVVDSTAAPTFLHGGRVEFHVPMWQPATGNVHGDKQINGHLRQHP